jgi:diguanylate cyclase (GGDEF)-like protein
MLQSHILLNQIVMITIFAALAGGAMHGQHVRAVRVEQQLSYMARADGLTGLASRSHIQAVLDQALAGVSERSPVSIVLIDLDRFKEVNDLFGHNMGDSVLRGVAGIINGCTTAQQTSGRWGGEEFLVVCRGARLVEAAELAERIRARLSMQLFPPVGRITASLGVAQALPDESEEHLVGRADAGLYTAKDSGRDRVVVVGHAAD